jgi:peptidoglycan/xylan/chitin deacetylase (PgdA/CDA1 family)
MSSNPITTATSTRKVNALYHRFLDITHHYGLTAMSMERALDQFSEILEEFDCPATFPVTAVPLTRHSQSVYKYLSNTIEFAVHGYTHIDYTKENNGTLARHLQAARDIFIREGLPPAGFRSPYLSRSESLYSALAMAGFSYASNQPFLWEGVDLGPHNPGEYAAYQRLITRYDPWKSGERLSLPRLANELVEIPVSLPDDEILVDRLGGSSELVGRVWRSLFAQSYQCGELFTLQLHPERIALCAESLASLLAEARQRAPSVWCAGLAEVAAWWRKRSQAGLEVFSQGEGEYHCVVDGPPDITVLARGVAIDAPGSPWMGSYREVKATGFHMCSPLRPVVGVPPSSPPLLVSFLSLLGYPVELSSARELYGCYIDLPDFAETDERKITQILESSDSPIVRLGYWPNGYASALCITGDIDAFTLWDFGLRLLGK